MHRREWLTTVGAVATGLTAEVQAAQASHEATDASRYLAPVNQLHAYLCAFHTAKKDPGIVIEAHHYCSPVGEEVHQCVIYDRNDKNARILGVEYIISDRLYRTLPDEEKKYYHPHTYEIISGLLIAPGLTRTAEKDLMEGLLTTWGKTWHTWPDPKTALPMGEPMLMWSATKDGQIPGPLLSKRDEQFGITTADIRRRRAYLGQVPQIDAPRGLNDLGRQWTNQGPDLRPSK